MVLEGVVLTHYEVCCTSDACIFKYIALID